MNLVYTGMNRDDDDRQEDEAGRGRREEGSEARPGRNEEVIPYSAMQVGTYFTLSLTKKHNTLYDQSSLP